MKNLFEPIVAPEKQHLLFKMMLEEQYGPERAVLEEWAVDFVDRDGKFLVEFQTTFESSLWELYLNASLRALGVARDFGLSRPDFVAHKAGQGTCIEATVAAPAAGGSPAYGTGSPLKHLPDDLNEFNRQATLRISNSFMAKTRKYREEYVKLPQCADTPFVISIASFDRPMAQLASNRPIISALYGLYFDEEETIRTGAQKLVRYNVDGARKSEQAMIEMAYFCDDRYSDISAVVYSCLATWGKVRALADNPDAKTVYVTLHPNKDSILPIKRVATKAEYREELLDGLYVFHNPHARRPVSRGFFDHPRIVQFFVKPDGELEIAGPDDMLLFRYLHSFVSKRGSPVS